MRVVHFLTSTASSLRGGMEQSTLRVAAYLAGVPGTKVIVYARDGLVAGEDLSRYACGGVTFVDLKPHIDAILVREGGFNDFIYAVGLVFSATVKRNIRVHDGCHHVIVSFYISTNGFNAQNTADELGLPHVACIRGTDFTRDYHRGDRFAMIGFVVQKATLVVTCNQHQAALARRVWGRKRGLVTIYNSVSLPADVYWKPHRNRATLHAFSDTGYSLRKGTHRLIRVFDEIIAEKSPVRLRVVGKPVDREASFWRGVRSKFRRRRGPIRLDDFLTSKEVLEALLDADIYCTASLAEGCPNGTLTALALGVPIVAGRCGAVVELGRDFDGLFLFDPADLDEMKRQIIEAISWVRDGGGPRLSRLARFRSELKPHDEAAKWIAAIGAVAPGSAREPLRTKLETRRKRVP